MDKFRHLLSELIETYGGTKTDLAARMGITPSSLSHMLTGGRPPSVEVCLRLAAATNTSASRVLRAAGKGEIADLIEGLYGLPSPRRASTGPRMSLAEERYLVGFRRLPVLQQRAFYTLLDYHLKHAQPANHHPQPVKGKPEHGGLQRAFGS